MTDKYSYRVQWSEEDGEYVGLCAEFPSLSWLDETPEATHQGVRRLIDQVVKDLRRTGEAAPEPFATRKYSGKLALRIPPELHRRLSLEAAEQEVSLNRWLTLKLASGGGARRLLPEAAPRLMSESTRKTYRTKAQRDTYKYQFVVGNRVVHRGITDDPERRMIELRQTYGNDGKVVKIGRRTTRAAAEAWKRKTAEG